MLITMLHRDHAPPHFHVRYGGRKASIDIRTLSVSAGGLPPTALRLVLEWAEQHQTELMDNWNRAQAGIPLLRIEPLE